MKIIGETAWEGVCKVAPYHAEFTFHVTGYSAEDAIRTLRTVAAEKALGKPVPEDRVEVISIRKIESIFTVMR